MADHIPFVTGEEGAPIAAKVYANSTVVRIPLLKAAKLVSATKPMRSWLDPCVDGMDDVESRRSIPGKKNAWFDFLSECNHFASIANPDKQSTPVASEVNSFVKAVMDKCIAFKPAWITVPQIPLVEDAARNKINRALAVATGKWKSQSGFNGRLILPLVVTHQGQIVGKTKRNPKVQQAEKSYHEAQADGFWVVDQSLKDESGSGTLTSKRFPSVIAFHQELNERIPSKIRIGGPYWGLNIVLWSKGLVDFPAVGIGTGFQYFLAGGHATKPSVKLAIPSLRRRVGVSPQFRKWLDGAISKLGQSHPAYQEFDDLRKNYGLLSQAANARQQVAAFYKDWLDQIESVPRAGRSMALFQDLSAAYALGKSLPELPDEGTARRPEAVAEPLMLSCL